MGDIQLFGQLASTGVVGVLLALAILALRAKDRELQLEKAARIEDSKAMMTLAMELQKQVILAVNKLSELVETWEKREQQRELSELQARQDRRTPR